MQREEKQKSLASPTEPQTKGLHSTRYEQTYNGAINGSQFPLHIDIGNTN